MATISLTIHAPYLKRRRRLARGPTTPTTLLECGRKTPSLQLRHSKMQWKTAMEQAEAKRVLNAVLKSSLVSGAMQRTNGILGVIHAWAGHSHPWRQEKSREATRPQKQNICISPFCIVSFPVKSLLALFFWGARRPPLSLRYCNCCRTRSTASYSQCKDKVFRKCVDRFWMRTLFLQSSWAIFIYHLPCVYLPV